MSDCGPYREALAEYAAENEPPTSRWVALDRHLADCPRCQAELARLRQVDASLRAWPRAVLAHDLVEPVMAQLTREPAAPAWHVLPWAVWVPALAIALALGIVLTRNLVGASLPIAAPAPVVVNVNAPLASEVLRQPLNALESDLFWAIWCGLFAILAGVGIGLGLGDRGLELDGLSADLREHWEHLREATHL